MTNSYVATVEVRYRDLDPNNHANHAVYASYLEHARSKYYRDVLQTESTELHNVVVSLSIDYYRPVEHGNVLDVHIYLSDIGGSSVTKEYKILSNDELVAEGETTHVFVDDNGSKPVPDKYRTRLENYHS